MGLPGHTRAVENLEKKVIGIAMLGKGVLLFNRFTEVIVPLCGELHSLGLNVFFVLLIALLKLIVL